MYVQNVDYQRSAAHGILLFVVGVMWNGDGPERKFSQTFFLAPQANGFFILNDILRFAANEETEEEVVTAPVATEEQEVEEAVAVLDMASDLEQEKPTPVAISVESTPLAFESTVSTVDATIAVSLPIVEEKIVSAPTKEKLRHAAPSSKNAVATAAGATTKSSWAKLAVNGQERWGNAVSNSVAGVVSSAPAKESVPASGRPPVAESRRESIAPRKEGRGYAVHWVSLDFLQILSTVSVRRALLRKRRWRN